MHISTITGTVKWFDTIKGFGFVVPDDGLPDVLLPGSIARSAPAKVAYPGARLTCEVVHDSRGLRVTRVIGAVDGAVQPLSAARGPLVAAEIKWFDQQRGFGFLRDRVGDIFVHAEVVMAARLWPVSAGERVRAQVENGPNGRFTSCLFPANSLAIGGAVEAAV